MQVLEKSNLTWKEWVINQFLITYHNNKLDDKLYFVGDQSGVDLKDDSMSSNSFSEILNTVNTDDFGNLFKKRGYDDNDDDDGSSRGSRMTFRPNMYKAKDN